MSIKWEKNHQKALVVLGILLSVFIAIPMCFAGGALTIIQDEKQLAPRGSYIPERRVQEVLKKVKAHKAIMREKQESEDKKQLPEKDTPKPNSSKNK